MEENIYRFDIKAENQTKYGIQLLESTQQLEPELCTAYLHILSIQLGKSMNIAEEIMMLCNQLKQSCCSIQVEVTTQEYSVK